MSEILMVDFYKGKKINLLYRYMIKEHAQRMQYQGEIFINRLSFYKDEAALGSVVGDNDEGKKESYLAVDYLGKKKRHKMFPFLEGTEAKFKSITFSDVKFNFNKQESIFNVYTYCMSEQTLDVIPS